jgi:glycosyltransferase involved in cell wall biosynthesis
MEKPTQSKPLLSVIVPTLNEEAYIEKLLLSLKRQTYTNFEVVLSDDGSTDNTIEIAEKYGAVVVTNPKIGEFKSRNVGAFHSKGEILVFTSADAILPKDVLEKTLTEFVKNKNIVSVQRALFPYDGPLWSRIEYMFVYFILKLREIFFGISTGSSTFTAVRKKSFVKVGGYQDQMSDDGLLVKERLARVGKSILLLDRFVPISARRIRKLGFIGFNNHFIHLFMGIILPYNVLMRLGFYNNLIRVRQMRHERSKHSENVL